MSPRRSTVGALCFRGGNGSWSFPVRSVKMMNRIIGQVERGTVWRSTMDANHPKPEPTSADAISAAARQVANTLSAAAIVTYLTSGSTTLRAAQEQPGNTDYRPDARQRRPPSRGCVGRPQHTPGDANDFQELTSKASNTCFTTGFAHAGERIVITAGSRSTPAYRPRSYCGSKTGRARRKPSSLFTTPRE